MKFDQYKVKLSELLQQPKNDHEKKALLRYLCRSDLWFLLRHVCGRSDMDHEWLWERCREVQAAPDNFLDLWARDHYKSTVITFGKTIQDILVSHGDDAKGREVTVGIFSHTRPIAKSFLRQIMRELEGNVLLQGLFPDVLWANPRKEAPKWSEDEGIIVRRKGNPKECTVEAWGVVDGQPTGKHFSLQVYDDIVTLASVNTPDMITKTNDALALSFNLGTQGGKRRFIGTRYHFNDSYKMVMDRDIATPRIYAATNDGTANGEPVLLTQEQLDEKRRIMGPYIFSAQMLQNPVADETQGLKKEWLRFWDGGNYSGMNVYILCDAAGSKKKGRDYTVFWVIGLGEDRNYYHLEVVRDRFNLTQRGSTLMELHRKWTRLIGKPPEQVRYERYGMMGDIEYIQQLQAQQNYRFHITEVAGQLPKEDRIRRLVPIFEQGKFYLLNSQHVTQHDGKTTDLVENFIHQEYLCFPVSIHDDMLDSLSRIAEPDLPLMWPAENSALKLNFASQFSSDPYYSSMTMDF